MARKATINETEEIKQLDPRVFKDNRIDAMEIWGMRDFVEGKTAELEDHPKFPNPRSPRNMDQDVVAEIMTTGELLEPVKLYWTENNEIALVDGKTRMTGIGLYLRQNPKFIGKLEIPLQRVKGSVDEIQLLMLKYNLSETKRPLTEADVSKFLRLLEKRGVAKNAMLGVLDKSGRKGLIWLNHMMQILDANPVVVNAYEEGKIDFTTAKFVAKEEFANQPKLLETVQILKKESPQLKEAQIRKLAGVKKANRVTLGFEPALNYLFENVYLPVDQHLSHDDPETTRRFGIVQRRVEQFVKKEGLDEDYREMLRVTQLEHDFQVFMFFFKQMGVVIEDQRAFVESQLSEDQKAMLKLAREERGAPVTRPNPRKTRVRMG